MAWQPEDFPEELVHPVKEIYNDFYKSDRHLLRHINNIASLIDDVARPSAREGLQVELDSLMHEHELLHSRYPEIPCLGTTDKSDTI